MGSTSTLCEGLQSCMEPQLPQQHVVVVINKALCYKKAEESDLQSQKRNGDNNNIGGGWSLIQHLSNPKKDNEEKQVYVHPLVKRSSNTLSIKSLEMCTESLGSETGSDISESIEEYSFFLSESDNNSRPSSKCREIGKKHTSNKILADFPPPLTSINCVQVRPHREGDRLILKATTITTPKSCFKAERVDGRLRLSFWNNTEAEAPDVDESDRELLGENGYIRPRKCKENGSRIKGIPTWEPFWVAIS